MTVATVSIDRTSLGLGALVINGDGTPPLSLTEKGLGRPASNPRYKYADSDNLHGSLLLQVTREQSSLPLEVLVQANSSALLSQYLDEIDAALWQFNYDVTVTVDGVAKVWRADAAAWSVASGIVDHAHVSGFFEVLTITIPVYPIPGV